MRLVETFASPCSLWAREFLPPRLYAGDQMCATLRATRRIHDNVPVSLRLSSGSATRPVQGHT
jgi:hypothetical protein